MFSSFKHFLKQVIIPICIGIFLAKMLQLYVVEFNQIIGASMEPTFNEGDYVVSDKLGYHLDDIQSGDLIIVESNGRSIIKRAVAYGESQVTISSDEHDRPSIYVDDAPFPREYIDPDMEVPEDYTFDVEDNEVFAIGDNPNNSRDSRVDGGYFKDQVSGKVFLQGPFPMHFLATPSTLFIAISVSFFFLFLYWVFLPSGKTKKKES